MISQEISSEAGVLGVKETTRFQSLTGEKNSIRVLAYVHLRNIYNSTGAGRVARQLTSHLAGRTDVDLKILADPADYARVISHVGTPWSGYDYRFIQAETSRQQARWFLMNSPKGESYWPEAQIVFCTAESYVPTKRAKLAVTTHDAAYFEQNAHRPDGAFRKQRLKWRLLYGKLARKADLFHAVSQFSAERLAHFFPGIRSRIRVVHNAVTPHFFEPVEASGHAYLASAKLSNKPFILIPGGLHYRKNADLILQALPLLQNKHKDLKIVIVNHSDPAYVAKLRATGVKALVTGFVPDEALKALYTAARLVWFPSRYEGFGLPVIEAMACGTPVVTSRASSLPEIGGDVAVYADPNQAHSHVELVDAVLTDTGLQQQLRIKGRERAAKFTWRKAASELKAHFDSLL